MDKRYRIVFKGQLLPGFSLDEVCENLAEHFHVSAAVIRQKLEKLPAVLKSGLDVHQANHYLEVLAADGLITQLEVMSETIEQQERRLHQRRYAQDRRRSLRTGGIVADRRRGSDRRKPR